MIEFVMNNVVLVSIYLAGGMLRSWVTSVDAGRMHQGLRDNGINNPWFAVAIGYFIQIAGSMLFWPIAAIAQGRQFFTNKSDDEIDEIVQEALDTIQGD